VWGKQNKSTRILHDDKIILPSGKNVYYSGYWNDLQHRKKFFDSIAKKLFVDKYPLSHNYFKSLYSVRLDDWYKVTASDVSLAGGSGIMAKYHNSLFKGFELLNDTHQYKLSLQSIPHTLG
jgi:hypothetical protein